MKQRKKAGIHTQIEIESTIEEPSHQPALSRVVAGTLDEAVIGQTYTIIQVGGQGALRRRLLDMGLTPKTKVMVRKVAPMGDPIELHLRGYELTLRKEDARKIEIIEAGREDADICIGRKPKLGKNNAVQSTYGQQTACGKFSRGHCRKKARRHSQK